MASQILTPSAEDGLSTVPTRVLERVLVGVSRVSVDAQALRLQSRLQTVITARGERTSPLSDAALDDPRLVPVEGVDVGWSVDPNSAVWR